MKKGFTLLELMIVMVILGILVVFGFPYYMKYMEDAKLKKTYMNLTNLKKAIELYQIDSNNNRNLEDRMRLDNGANSFALKDLVDGFTCPVHINLIQTRGGLCPICDTPLVRRGYGYINNGSMFYTAWGEMFSLVKEVDPAKATHYSLYVDFNVYISKSKFKRREFLSVQYE